MDNPIYINLKVDTKPLVLFIKLFDSILKVFNRNINTGDFSFELARVESNFSPTGTNELLVTLYPSDAFLRFLPACGTRDIDFRIIKESSHKHLL